MKTKSKRRRLELVDLSKVERAEEFLLAAIREAQVRTGKVGHSPEVALREVFGSVLDVSLSGLLEGFSGCTPLDLKREYHIGSYGPLSADEVALSNRNRALGEQVRKKRYEAPEC